MNNIALIKNIKQLSAFNAPDCSLIHCVHQQSGALNAETHKYSIQVEH